FRGIAGTRCEEPQRCEPASQGRACGEKIKPVAPRDLTHAQPPQQAAAQGLAPQGMERGCNGHRCEAGSRKFSRPELARPKRKPGKPGGDLRGRGGWAARGEP